MFCLGPKPPIIRNIFSGHPKQIEVDWQSHCTGNSVDTCGDNRIPLEYTVRYKPAYGDNEMYASVKSTNPGIVLPIERTTLVNLSSNTKYFVAVKSNIYFAYEHGKTINSDFSIELPEITREYQYGFIVIPFKF